MFKNKLSIVKTHIYGYEHIIHTLHVWKEGNFNLYYFSFHTNACGGRAVHRRYTAIHTQTHMYVGGS